MLHTSKKELAETKGDIHKFLGLTINFSGRYDDPNKKGQVVFTMYNYIEDIINSIPPAMGGTAPDPVKFKLLTVHKTLPRLGIALANLFHSMMARLLFAVKQAQPDIMVAVAYLCNTALVLGVHVSSSKYFKVLYAVKYFNIQF